MLLTHIKTITLTSMIKAPEVWSIDINGAISRQNRLSVLDSKSTGVWGYASFVSENIIACAEDGEYIT